MNEQELAELQEQIRKEVLAELEQENSRLAGLREEVRTEVEAEMAEKFQRREGLVRFAEEICGGDGVALSAKPSDVVEFLETLGEDEAEKAMALLKAKVVDFGERGSSREGKPKGKKELPGAVITGLKNGTLTLADLENPILDLGELEQYDLSEWQE